LSNEERRGRVFAVKKRRIKETKEKRVESGIKKTGKKDKKERRRALRLKRKTEIRWIRKERYGIRGQGGLRRGGKKQKDKSFHGTNEKRQVFLDTDKKPKKARFKERR
jgi:hypothetical protein